jgi:hypothetical protein
LQNAPVGTFITFTYAANTNTRTQTVNTAPTQFASGSGDANANGIQIFTRAYNATSSAAQPAAIAIQIGKGLKGKSLDLYKSVGKVTAGSLDYGATSTANGYGAVYKDYNELTGILLVDAGYNVSGSNTQRDFLFSDISSQTSGYLVINASKNPALTGIGLNRIAMRATSTAGGAIGTSATLQTFAEEAFDTNNAWNGNTFTAPESGYYSVDASILTSTVSLAINQNVNINIYKNGVLYSIGRTVGSGGSTSFPARVSDILFLTKNDTIQIYANASTATTQNTATGFNFISISKVSV